MTEDNRRIIQPKPVGTKAPADKRKQSVYIPDQMILELRAECKRLDRSLSWVVQRCVKVGLDSVKELPSLD